MKYTDEITITTLTDGATVILTKMDNGSIYAELSNNQTMTESQWEELNRSIYKPYLIKLT